MILAPNRTGEDSYRQSAAPLSAQLLTLHRHASAIGWPPTAYREVAQLLELHGRSTAALIWQELAVRREVVA